MTAREFADAYEALDRLAPVDRARAIPALIEACRLFQSDLSGRRRAAMEEATAGPGRISRAALARELDISKSKVTEALGPAGKERERDG